MDGKRKRANEISAGSVNRKLQTSTGFIEENKHNNKDHK